MTRDIDRNGTYVLQLTAYLMYFYHRDLYGLAEKEADAKLLAEDPEHHKATQIMQDVMSHNHYSPSFKALFEVYFGKKFVIKTKDDWKPFKGAVILKGGTATYCDGHRYSMSAYGDHTYNSNRMFESPKMASLEDISIFFMAMRLNRRFIREDDTVGFLDAKLETNFDSKGGIKGVGRFQDEWATEALNAMFSAKPSIELVEGLTKVSLLDILDQKLEEKDNPTLRSFRRVLYSMT